MKNQKEINTVVEFIKKNPDSSTESIVVGTKVSDIMVRGALKNLLDEKVIVSDADTGTFSLAEQPVETPAAEKKAETKVSKKKKDEELGPKTFTGRNNDKYRFGEHRNLPKGRLVLAIVRSYVVFSFSDIRKRVANQALIAAMYGDEPLSAGLLLDIISKTNPSPSIL